MGKKISKPSAARELPDNTNHLEVGQVTSNTSANNTEEITAQRELPAYTTEEDTLALAQEAVRAETSDVEITTKRELPVYTNEQDTLTLAQEAVRARLIPQDVLDHLTFLHPQVPSSMKHRYLLTNLEERDTKSLQKLLLEYQSKPIGFPLGPQHFSRLTEHLAEYAHKWRFIGIALEFKPQELDNIQDSHASMAKSPLHNLTQLLEDWLLKKHKHALTPTVNTLKKALSSQIVGLGNVACELPSIFESELPVADLTSPYSIISMSIKINSQKVSICIDTYSVTTEMVNVEENTPALLEVQVTAQLEDKPIYMAYNWCENRLRLSKFYDNIYSTGIKKPILCINKADIDIDGYEFTCEVTTQLSDHIYRIETKPVTLKVDCPLDIYRDSLASMYLAQPEVPEDTWPPESNKKYLNLALIEQKKPFNYGEEHVHLTIRNDMDNILQHKKKIEYKEILKGLKSGQVLFVQGRSGCGKTTFVHKITQDWARATTSTGPMRLVLLVSLRVLNTLHAKKPDLDLSDILQLFNQLKVSKELLEEREGKGVCFIFDGLDEFSAPDSIVYRIIYKKYLAKSIVVVASRPAAIAKLRSRADKVIEILGFLKDQIIEYFERYPFSTHSKSAQLKEYLSSHPNILHMCYLPIHAAMVAYLFELTGKVPRTETEIYKHFTKSTLVRSLSKKVDLDDIDVHHLSGEQKKLFGQICRLALEKTILNKQVMEQDEVRDYFKTKKDTDVSLGLIIIDRIAGLYNYMNVYTFLHLTFQEYLAAHHISTLRYEEQNKLIQEHGHKNHMLVVWKFYCGLIKYDPKGCELFKTVLNEKSSLFLIQCAYESQQPVTCNLVLEHTNASLVFENGYITTPDFISLGYILANASSPVALSLKKCTIISNDGIDALISETGPGDRSNLLSTLEYETYSVNAVQMGYLDKLLHHFRSLKSLDASSRFIITMSNTKYKYCDNLTHLSVTNAFDHPNTLKTVLNRCKKLQRLVLKNTNRSEIEVLAACKNLEWLDIYYDRQMSEHFLSSDSGAIRFIVKFFEFYTHFRTVTSQITTNKSLLFSCQRGDSLQEIHVHHEMNSDVSRAFFKNSNEWNHLHTLELNSCFNNFSGKMTADIVDSLKHFSELKVLLMPNNHFSDREAVAIFSSLKHCTALTTLDLQCNKIHKEGAQAVGLCLQHWPDLQGLDLSNNRIISDEAEMIADNLHHCTQLRELNLSFNLIHNIATDYLIKKAKKCKQLAIIIEFQFSYF